MVRGQCNAHLGVLPVLLRVMRSVMAVAGVSSQQGGLQGYGSV